ncbi:MAG TPA: protein-glutamate O-methyltransferase CheR, partial [Thermomicrobiales bacterium]|nr:protein-glutamate O-methyltransferase CheR [Thermomicrobiales bacterium]
MTRTLAAPARPAAPLDAALRAAYLDLVEGRFGLRVAGHQLDDLDAAVADLLAQAGYPSARALWDALAAGTRDDLLERLAARLTIGETHFFRVGPQIAALRDTVLPDLLGRRAAERRLRLWSAGCSTGEEPYTLAILLREQLPAPEAWAIDLLGTDVSHPALAAARRAVYGEWSFRDTPEAIRERYFVREGRHWRLTDAVRRMVRFAHQNLAADGGPAPGSDFDLIACRNVTIYFSAETTQRLYRRFAAALAPGGWLLLGPSDPVPESPGPLTPCYLPGAILWRRPLAGERPAAPAPARPAAAPAPRRQPAPAPKSVVGARPHRPAVAATPSAPPADAAEAVARVRELVAAGEPAAARDLAAGLAGSQPLATELHLLLGLLHLDAGAAEPALASLRRAVFLDGGHALAHASLGRAYLGLGDPARARAALLHARRLLAAEPGERAVPGGDGLTADDLRRAVEAQLA